MAKKLFIFFTVIFIFVFILSCGTKKEQEIAESGAKKLVEFEWGNLKNLGPNINSPGKDEHITLTPDGKTAIFASIREDGMGKYDLYMSRFENGEWTRAELLPAPLNTEKDEFDPFLISHGTKLLFATNRDNSDKYWDCDIWVAEWDGEKWNNLRAFDPIFITPDKPDWSPTVSRDLKTFIFSSGRAPSNPNKTQIFQSLWSGDKWSEPEAFPDPINSGGLEGTPHITPDGNALYICSDRGEEGKKDVDIWKFELINGSWTNAQLMTGPFLSDEYDYDPCISPDGTKFYFTSNREGGLGDSDIWVVEKIVKE